MASPKYEILNEIANKVQVLDNPIKLKILAMLVEEGSKSVTDISKDMSLNFSTAHKYLEQLEAAGLVTSKQVSENRLKRIFSIGDFNIDISPHGLSNFISQKKTEPKKTFKVINERGEEVQFDEKIFSQKYIKRGLPARTISNALDKVAEQVYDGITLLELRELFRKEMAKKLETITNVMEMIEESEIRGRTFYNLLKLNHPEALKMHMDGDIFIQNLGEPKLLNFVHDLYGIAQHGVAGKKPKNQSEFFEQIIFAIKFTSEFTRPQQSLDAFNYFLAPFVEELGIGNLRNSLKKLFSEIEDLKQEIFICLDFNNSYAEKLRISYATEAKLGEKTETYEKYRDLAKKIALEIISLLALQKYNNVKLVVKLWDKDVPQSLPIGTLLVKMTNVHQQPNASYVGFTRFGPDWASWFGTKRVGEMQEVIINLPKIAATSVSLEEFSDRTARRLNECHQMLLNMAELTVGEFLRAYNTTLISAQRERWNYLDVWDCVYSISIAGLPETIAILSKRYAGQDLQSVAQKINQKFLEVRKKYPRIRINLKQNRSESICKRFSKCANYKINFDAPLPISKILLIQKYFPGGHIEFVNKDAVNKNFEFGVIKITSPE